MTGAALWAFLITTVGLIIIAALIFFAIEMIKVDEGFKKIARFAVGGAALLIFLVAVGGVFGFGGAGMVQVTPASIIEFAIGLIVLMIILYVVYMVVAWFGVFADPINYVVSGIAVIVILILALRAITGGMGFVPKGFLRSGIEPTVAYAELRLR